jgi:hypothetical protein
LLRKRRQAKLPTTQFNVMFGRELTDYLNTKCAKDELGKPDWMIQDDDFTENQILVLPERWRKPYKDAVTYAHGLKPLDNERCLL